MTEFMTEEEQVEQIKNWIKQYGMTVIAGIVIALIIISGWHYWERYQTRILTHASHTYDEMLALRAQNNSAGAVLQAQKLLTHYPKTPYAQLAGMVLARDAVTNKNYPEAIKQLNSVIDRSKNASIIAIAKARMARIYIAQNKPEEALDLLNKVQDKNFNGLIDEIKGDAYLMQKDNTKAKASYQLALKELPAEEVTQRPLLQMKLDNLATESDAS